MLRVAEEFHGTHTGQQRRANEDSLYARNPLFAVADGMGGAQAGEIASSMAVEVLAGGLPESASGADVPLEDRLADRIHEANERIHARARTDERCAGMGTTMTVLLVGEGEVTIAHVGDSRAYLLRDSELSRLTRDHSLVEELVEQGRLSPEEASRHPQRSVITRSVGPEPRVQVDTLTTGARAGDVFLICSDGLTTMIDEPDVRRILLESGSLEEAGHGLIDAANAAGGRDNITVVLVRLEDVRAGGGDDGPATAVHDTADTQVTSHGDESLRTSDVQAALEAQERAGARSSSATATAERPSRQTRRIEPIVPGGGGTEPPKKPRKWVRRLAIVSGIIGFVAFPVWFGGYVALRAVYFVGADDRGFVTVYRGLPYELPLGIELYGENYTSPVPVSQVPAGRRATVVDQSLRSQKDAYDLVRQLELGQVQGNR
ncbi:MAG TPA: Stp1/IreP family PP2C-type Ser/Thr phosphatase [Solirubrobacteraceae bacterium]|nr:Stp1/IreP family PP2C-type Ser/Thr phosphatase [Solirubrobacteraceae bacterium]